MSEAQRRARTAFMAPYISEVFASVAPQSIGTFEIRAKGNAETDVFIYGDIGPGWNDSNVLAAQFVRDLQNVDAKVINARINSYGGSVSDALAIYNALQRHPATVNTFVDGVAVSAASLIAMAGNKVTMAENAVMMIHGPWAMASGNAQAMREAADILDKYAQAMAPSYASKTGKPASEMLALLTDGADHWYTATEAQAAGFADEISAVVAIEASFDLARYRSAPAAAAAFQRRSSAMTPEELAAKAAADAATAKMKADKEAADKQAAVVEAVAAKAAADAVAAAKAAGATPTIVTNGRTKEQIAEIKATFAPFINAEGIKALYDAILEDPSITVDAAGAKLLSALGKDSGPANPTAHHVVMGEAERDKYQAACTDALLARAGLATPEIKARLGANPYRGHRMLDMARASLERLRIDTRGMTQMEIVAAGFTQSTSDFPILLENTMHKALLGAYALAAWTWPRFCAKGSVSDFRPSNRYRVGSFSNLDTVNELGEFKNKSIPDGEKSYITATTKGNIINISRQAVINDDLGAFVGLASMLGHAAGRSVEADVYTLLAQNSGAGPTMSDSGILFNSTAITTAGGHANRAAYAAPTVLLIDAGRQAMAKQKDPSQNDYLDLRPVIWLGTLADGGTARVINAAQYDPDTSNKLQRPNMVANLFRDVIDSPRITWNGWYMFADPAIAPAIEVAFLDGNDQPFIELQNGFEVDGAKYKVRLDYGVKERDYRGAYASVAS